MKQLAGCFLMVVFGANCAEPPSYTLDYTNVPVSDYGGIYPGPDYHDKMEERTRSLDIVFETSQNTYRSGDEIDFTITNNSQTSYYLCDTTTQFDFDEDGDGWVSMSPQYNFAKVCDEPKVAGMLTKANGAYGVYAQIDNPEQLGEPEYSDAILFQPGETLQFFMTLPEMTGEFQVWLYCADPDHSWGLRPFVASNGFTVE